MLNGDTMNQEATTCVKSAADGRPIHVLELRSVRGVGGGPEKTILAGAVLADRTRVRVTVCYLRAKDDPQFDVHRRARELGVDYVEVPERHSFDPTIVRTLRTLVRQRGIDLVHAHDYKTDLLALALRRLEGVVPLATVHGWTGHTTPERWLYYPADKRLLRAFPRVIAVSSQIRDELVRTGSRAGRITVVLNGIDPTVFCRDRNREEAARRQFNLRWADLVVGAVGRLEPQKRFDVLLRAFARASHEDSRWRLLIAGEGSCRGDLERLVRELGLGGRVTLLGQVTDVVTLHHALDLFVQSSDYEGTPNAVLEAMALETPAVVTDAGGTSELIEDGVHGTIVPPADVAGLAKAMGEAFADRNMTTRRSRAARQRVVDTLSFVRRTRLVEDIYGELVPTSRRAATR
jgi:glycosyltransferase involved in cell wall biosynthesis